MYGDAQKINVLIVDDEKKACTNLRNILREYIDTGIYVLGLAYNTSEAEEQILRLRPDAVFLDIEMPNENAFQFLDRISPLNFEVIFVTAYDEYAVKAFKLNAVDYILKPISINELKGAIDRLRERMKFKKLIGESAHSYKEIADSVNNKTGFQKITIRDANNSETVNFTDLYFIEAQSSYSRIVFLKGNKLKEMTMSSPLSDYEEILPANIFFRIHRSYLVNCGHIKQVLNDGSNELIMADGTHLPIGRRRYPFLLSFLQNNDCL